MAYTDMSDSAQAAIREYHRLNGLSNRNAFLTILGAGNLRSGCQRGQVRPLAWFADGCLLAIFSHGTEGHHHSHVSFSIRALTLQPQDMITS